MMGSKLATLAVCGALLFAAGAHAEAPMVDPDAKWTPSLTLPAGWTEAADAPIDENQLLVKTLLSVSHFSGTPTLAFVKTWSAGAAAPGLRLTAVQLRTTAAPENPQQAVRDEQANLDLVFAALPFEGSRVGAHSEFFANEAELAVGTKATVGSDAGPQLHAITWMAFSATLAAVDGAGCIVPAGTDATQVALCREALATLRSSIPKASRRPVSIDQLPPAAPPGLTAQELPAWRDGPAAKLPPINLLPRKRAAARDLRWLYAVGGLLLIAAVLLYNRKVKATLAAADANDAAKAVPTPSETDKESVDESHRES